MQAILNDHVIAEADKADLIYIEGNWYFPPASVDMSKLSKSDTPYTCPWKGKCQYFNVEDQPDMAWSYPDILPSAVERVHKDFSNYVAFSPGVEVKD